MWRAVMGDETEARSESACDAAGNGDLAKLDRELERLWVSDTNPAQVLRSAMGHFQKLIQAREGAQRGESIDNVMKRLRPPVHFSRATSFKVQAQRWSSDRLGDALDMLLDAEAMTRTTGVPAEAVTGAHSDEHRRHGEGTNVMLKVRVIPCLDVKDGRVVKGINFEGLRDAGDPVEQAIVYDKAGADELCFLDITASHENRGTLLDVVHRTAEVCFMPLTVGGGVRTLEDIRALLLAGADKVSINTRRGQPPRICERSGREIRQPVHCRRHRRQGRGQWPL